MNEIPCQIIVAMMSPLNSFLLNPSAIQYKSHVVLIKSKVKSIPLLIPPNFFCSNDCSAEGKKLVVVKKGKTIRKTRINVGGKCLFARMPQSEKAIANKLIERVMIKTK